MRALLCSLIVRINHLSGVDFNKVDLVFNLVKFLVHHHDCNNESGACVKLDYFS